MSFVLGASLESFSALLEEEERIESINTDEKEEVTPEQIEELHQKENEVAEAGDQVDMAMHAILTLNDEANDMLHLKKVIMTHGLSESLFVYINKNNSLTKRCKRMCGVTIASTESFVEGNKSQKMEVVASLESMLENIKKTISKWIDRVVEFVKKYWNKFTTFIKEKYNSIKNKIKRKFIKYDWIEAGVDPESSYYSKSDLFSIAKYMDDMLTKRCPAMLSEINSTVQTINSTKNSVEINIDKFREYYKEVDSKFKAIKKINAVDAGRQYGPNDPEEIGKYTTKFESITEQLNSSVTRVTDEIKKLRALQFTDESDEANKQKQKCIGLLNGFTNIVRKIIQYSTTFTNEADKVIRAMSTASTYAENKEKKESNK